jgi:polyribonucleotide nucleotidyltransferase
MKQIRTLTFPTRLRLVRGTRAATTATSEIPKETSATAQMSNNDSITFSTGKIARLASGAVTSQTGTSVVLATAVSDPYMTDKGFMPMTVDFRTKIGAMGLIPSNLFRKEMGIADSEILAARVIDRTLRPLFPEGYHHESQIITTLQSFDPNHSDVEVQSINAASTALCISDIPFNGPVAAVRVARSKDGTTFINPTTEYLDSEDCIGHLLYAGVESRPIMLEGEMNEWSEADITTAMERAHVEIQPLLLAQKELQSKVGKPKRSFEPCIPDATLYKLAHDMGLERALAVVRSDLGVSKADRGKLQGDFYSWMKAELEQSLGEEATSELHNGVLHKAAESVMKTAVRQCALEENPMRFDGRPIDQVRQILLDTGVLPVVHGSALFSRGDTQTLCTSTIGGLADAMQVIRGLDADAARASGKGKILKNFFLQYEFPPYSVNEVGRVGGVNRRMVGHGALAEKALIPVLPSAKVLPLNQLMEKLKSGQTNDLGFSSVLRVTSEVSGSDGSSSMATVCGATASLLNAGVPLRAPVAGVSIGLMTPSSGAEWGTEGKYQLLTDILGAEDHFGDMDFKIAGTSDGVTALQLDMKQEGIPLSILSEAMDMAKTARFGILEKMEEQSTVDHHKTSKTSIQRCVFELEDQSSMGQLIGPKGANIRALEAKFPTVKITTGNSGMNSNVEVASNDQDALEECIAHIHGMFLPLEVGQTYTGTVGRVDRIGAFVDLDGMNRTVLVHVSELEHGFVKDSHQVCSVGDKMEIMCLKFDKRLNKFQFSRKALLGGASADWTGGSSSSSVASIANDAAGTIDAADVNDATNTLGTDTTDELYDFIVEQEKGVDQFDKLSPEAASMLSGLNEGAPGQTIGGEVSREGDESESVSVVQNTRVPEAGQTFMGEVMTVRSYGAFVDIGCNRQGMLHVSELDDGESWVESVSQKVNVGDLLQVQVSSVTKKGDIYLTQKFEANDDDIGTTPNAAPNDAPIIAALSGRTVTKRRQTGAAKISDVNSLNKTSDNDNALEGNKKKTRRPVSKGGIVKSKERINEARSARIKRKSAEHFSKQQIQQEQHRKINDLPPLELPSRGPPRAQTDSENTKKKDDENKKGGGFFGWLGL